MAALLIAGTAISVLGQIQAGREAEAMGESAQNIANYNAAIQEREARAIRQKAGFEQRRQAEAAARTKSRLRARLAASGALMEVGAPLMLQEEQAVELELENLGIGYEAEVGVQRTLSQAELDRLQGRIYREKGKVTKKAAYLGAGTTLLTGFGEAWD